MQIYELRFAKVAVLGLLLMAWESEADYISWKNSCGKYCCSDLIEHGEFFYFIFIILEST